MGKKSRLTSSVLFFSKNKRITSYLTTFSSLLFDTRKVLIVLFLFALVKSLVFAHFGITMLTDDNQDFTAATRILHGDIIFRDYQAFLPPISDYFLAFLLALNNSSYIISVYVYVLISSFFPPLFYLLVKKVSNLLLAFIFSIGIVFSFVRLDLLFFYTFFFAAYLLAIKYIETKKLKYALCSGFFLMLGSLFRIDNAVFTALGIFTLFFLEFLRSKKKKDVVLAGGVLFLIPLAVNLMIMFWLIGVHGLVPWTNDVRQGLVAKQHWTFNLYEINNLFPHVLSLENLYNTFNGWIYIIWFLVSIPGVFYIIHLLKAQDLKEKNIIIVSLLTSFVASLFYIRIHYDLPHFVKACMIFFPVLASFIVFPINKSVRSIAFLSFLAFVLVQIAFSVWLIKYSDNLLSIPKRGVYVFVNSKYIPGTTLPSKKMILDSVYFLQQAEHSEKVFVLPYMSMLYYLSNRQNQTIYNNLLDGAMVEPYDQKYMIQSLKNSKVRFIVYDRQNNPKEQKGNYSLMSYYPLLDSYIMKNYHVKKNINGWLLMKK